MENVKTGKLSVSKRGISVGGILKFILPSLIGVALLMTPFKQDGGTTVGVALMSGFINRELNSIVPIYQLVMLCIAISCFLALAYRIAKPAFIENSPLLREVSDISGFWLVARFTGLVLGLMTAFKAGPELIWSGDTGGLILHDLICGLFTIFLIAGFILPFLTEFGLLEYVGVFMTGVMRPLFNLPGRSAVDCVASWIGDGTIGVTLTNKQYEDGYYTEREAAVIATTFSLVSITFCLVVLTMVKMTNYFAQYYLTVCLAGVLAALIIPRIPPLSLKKDVYCKVNPHARDAEIIPEGYSRSKWALQLAVNQAEKNGNVFDFLGRGAHTVLGLWLGVTPIIMAAGTLALVMSEGTPVFTWLGKPFLPILNLLNVPEAVEASKTMVVGFADMVVPSILADANITSEMTRFIVAATSVSQLLYMSETGAVILGSNLPISLLDLFVIFIERTLVTLPFIVMMAYIWF